MTLENLIGTEAAQKLRATGLHKLAAARLRSEGHPVEGDLGLRSAIQALGTNVYIKNAEAKRIFDGLISLDNLTREE